MNSDVPAIYSPRLQPAKLALTSRALAIAGSGKADKAQVTRMVTRLLNLPAPPKPDDAADALALAITALRSRNFRKLTLLAKASR